MSKQKEKFFAQYWGQEVAVWNDIFGTPKRYIGTEALNATYLELNPLSQISDEDAIEVAKIINLHRKHIEHKKEDINDLFSEDFLIIKTPVVDLIKSEQFMRSKGYALPWMGISVEEQISKGWVKLKTNSNE